MKDAEYRKHQRRVETVRKRWRQFVGLGDWTVTFEYFDGALPPDESNPVLSARVAGDCWAEWQYLRARIRVSVPHVAEMDDEGVEQFVVHELCHATVNELREEGIDHEERVVTGLARALIAARRAGFAEGRRVAKG